MFSMLCTTRAVFTLILPSLQDRLLADVLHGRKEAVVSYLQHDTLFQNMDDEKLTEAVSTTII